MDFLLPALLSAALGGAAGWFVPRLVARVPEPVPQPVEQPVEQTGAEPGSGSGPGTDQERPAKEPYADIARSPGLAVRAAIASALVAGVFGGALGWSWPLVYLVPFVPLAVALAIIDWRTRLLPTWLIAPAYPVLIVLVLLAGAASGDWDDLRRAGYGWLVMGGFYAVTWLVSRRLLGYGDVRLSGLLGIALGYLGWGQLVVGMVLAFPMLGLPPLLLAVVKRDVSVLRMQMPFGPAMLASAAIGVVFGADIGRWYLRLSGLEV